MSFDRGFLCKARVKAKLAEFDREDAEALARQRDNQFSRAVQLWFTKTNPLTRGETRDSSEVSSPPQPAAGDR